MRLLANFLSPIDAHIILGRMLSEDIYAVVIDENIVWNNYMYSQAFGGVKLLVHHLDAERAQMILIEIEENKFLLDKTAYKSNNKKKSTLQYRSSVLINTFLVLFLFLIFGIALPLKAEMHSSI
ncbi:conserved protein of unknown function [Xenorhabdus poinarii G6]|uniref:DUF2007 domain-containing protein n=2 Tax=Xenorhabdus poinarii TaxID=40577 RepID=A0A068R1Z8_9GAMM|nr:conserved protein of unknown function [Xenorhabdus poinarii G6]